MPLAVMRERSVVRSQLDGTANGINYAAEFDDAAVASALHHRAIIESYGRVNQIAAKRAQPRKCPILVGTGELTVSGYVRRKKWLRVFGFPPWLRLAIKAPMQAILWSGCFGNPGPIASRTSACVAQVKHARCCREIGDRLQVPNDDLLLWHKAK